MSLQIRTDDISSVLILNKKAITNQEHALFKTELEKFRPYQVRIMQAVHKQTSLVKELKQVYDLMLADKRVKKETERYHGFSRQKNSVVGKYRKVCSNVEEVQTFSLTISSGLASIQRPPSRPRACPTVLCGDARDF